MYCENGTVAVGSAKTLMYPTMQSNCLSLSKHHCETLLNNIKYLLLNLISAILFIAKYGTKSQPTCQAPLGNDPPTKYIGAEKDADRVKRGFCHR